MTLQDLGNIGEFVGAIGVVVSLIYLAVQIRQNTATVRLNSTTAHAQAVQTAAFKISESSDMNKLWWSGLANRAALEDDDKRRWDGLMSGQLLVLEQAWRFHEEGVVDDVTWEPQRSGIAWLAHSPGFIDYWKVWHAMHHPGFGAHVAKAMSEDTPAEVTASVELTVSADPLRDASQT